MYLAAEPEKTSETHDQGTPTNRIDVGSRTINQEQRFLDMQLHDVNLEYVGIHVLSEWPEILHNAFHLDRAFKDTWRRYRF